MSFNDEILSLMDLLDLDEEVIDSRLETIMVRNTYSNKHLKNALQLLQYKQMINLQENTECENDNEINFLAKIISIMHEGNIDIICKVTRVVLSLNKRNLIGKSEHLIQQILSNIDLSSNNTKSNVTEDMKPCKILLNLKLCDSILDVAIKNRVKLSLLFVQTHLENILSNSDEKLKVNFLTNTVPRMFNGVIGYNILDQIWNYLKLIDEKENALKVLSCLSEFYLPISDEKGNMKFASEIVFDCQFWHIILSGLQSNDPAIRKISVYLIKRAIDFLIASKKNVHVRSDKETLFIWEQKTRKEQEQMWNNYFILIDSLEEKQSNIVLPSLKLFDTLKDMQNCWLKCAFNIALKHDNMQVKLKCIEYRLQLEISSEEDATILLEALNDINLYDCVEQYVLLKEKFAKTLKDTQNFKHIFKSISKVKWSPVPMYHLSKVLASVKNTEVMINAELAQTVIDILKVPCNNIAIRKAVHINTFYFVGNCCRNLNWKEIIKIYSSFEFTPFSLENEHPNPFEELMSKFCAKVLSIDYDNKFDDDADPFQSLITGLWSNLNADEINSISDDRTNIDFCLYCLKSLDGMDVFINRLGKKVEKIKDIINRQYSDKRECLNDVIYITELYHKTFRKCLSQASMVINTIVSSEYNTIIKYILSLLSNETDISVEEIILLFKRFPSKSSLSAFINDTETQEIQLQLYKSSMLLLKDGNTELQKKVMSIFITNILTNDLKNTQCEKEMLNLNQMLNILSKTEFRQVENKESNGRLRNVFFEKSCELIYNSLKQRDAEIKSNLKEILEFIKNVTECGGYGCLSWILKIMNEIVPQLLSNESITFNMILFIDKMWKEIEELKSNNQYSPCINEFVNLITQEALLKKSMYNNIVIYYCNQIIEHGPMKNAPLFYLIRNLNSKDITKDHGQIIYILSEILLYSPVPRKDQRITENVAVEILHDPKYGLNQNYDAIHFNYEIKHLSVLSLCKIEDPEILDSIVSVITSQIDNTFRNKQRYHGSSQPHRLLLTGLQHILVIGLLSSETVYNERVLSWIIELMEKLPHQASVRICLEWYIALYLYVKDVKLDENIEILKSSKIPITSQFAVLYWVLKHKIANDSYKDEEYYFVMDKLLSYTMGQSFSVRLHAQYLASQLYEMKSTEKYMYTIEIIQRTFKEGAKDKSFIKLKEEFFANNFDLVKHLTPCFVYYFLPRYFDIGVNELVDISYIKKASKEINILLIKGDSNINDFKKAWIRRQVPDEDLLSYNFSKNVENDTAFESDDTSGTIQKKYIPWKNMSDIEVHDTDKKRGSSSELIVVASLIDKLPNLGGMARTCEVFGVKTYVVDSLRHLQDKQFQGLSVSAERWVDIEEVRPGQPLKNYLLRMKAQGYSVVAAEQTSTSCNLQSFQFPKKTLLLLGHEKEGIPCDLLLLMDHCVEIPQQGFVRSLNVHVTASIFIWEYVRQNVL